MARTPRPIGNADRAIWLAHQFLKGKSASGWPTGVFPADLAKSSGMSRLESELALRMVAQSGRASKRRDGRYFSEEVKKEN